MAQLNKTFIEELKQGFGSTHFSANDFTFTFPPKGKILCRLNFKYDESFEFTITEEEVYDLITQRNALTAVMGGSTERKDKSIAVYVIHSPGQYKKTDKIEIADIGDAAEHLRNWCHYLYSELSHDEQADSSFDDLRREIEDKFEETIDDPDGKFDADEIAKIESKFDALLSKFETLEEESKITKEELTRIKKDMDGFKSSAKVMRKGLWARITNNKLVDIAVSIAKSKEGRDLIISQIKKLISGE
ncbi:MAG: hypothetical protein NXI15_09060 [Gammaproteobacteria bacterium]|nr:hypothetical protein [Gammaproteobacteria bacterium]